MPTQCDHYWAGLRCQLWAGHASAHAAREDDALISWRSDEHGDRLVLDWADRDDQPGPAGRTEEQPDEQPDDPADEQPAE
jgi:hypothetical protein